MIVTEFSFGGVSYNELNYQQCGIALDDGVVDGLTGRSVVAIAMILHHYHNVPLISSDVINSIRIH